MNAASPRCLAALLVIACEAPDSPFFANTTMDWVEGRYAPLAFSRADAEADAAERWTLSP